MEKERVEIRLNDIVLDLEIAHTKELKHKGLSGIKSMPYNEGMMFVWDNNINTNMVMRGMEIPLDFFGFDSNNVIKQIESANTDFDDSIEFNNVVGIIEVNKGFIDKHNVKIGDIFTFVKKNSIIKFRGGGTTKYKNEAQEIGEKKFDIDSSIVKKGKLYLLDKDGKIVMELRGDERIFSGEHTKELFELVKEARISGDYTKVGKRLKEIFKIHNNQEPEFAENL